MIVRKYLITQSVATYIESLLLEPEFSSLVAEEITVDLATLKSGYVFEIYMPDNSWDYIIVGSYKNMIALTDSKEQTQYFDMINIDMAARAAIAILARIKDQYYKSRKTP